MRSQAEPGNEYFFPLPSSLFPLPSSDFRLPTSIGLTSVTSVTESVAEPSDYSGKSLPIVRFSGRKVALATR